MRDYERRCYFEPGSTGDELARSEQQVRKGHADRLTKQAQEDRRTRERLQGGLGPMEAPPRRANIEALLNLVGHVQGSGIDTLLNLRKSQELGRVTAQQHNRSYERFEKTYGSVHEAPSVYNFEPSERDPVDSRFEWAEGSAEGNADRVRDADGSMSADTRTRRDHWNGQGTHAVDPAFVLEVARAVIEAINSPRYSRGKV